MIEVRGSTQLLFHIKISFRILIFSIILNNKPANEKKKKNYHREKGIQSIGCNLPAFPTLNIEALWFVLFGSLRRRMQLRHVVLSLGEHP